MKLIVFVPLLAASLGLALYLKLRELRAARRPSDPEVLAALEAAGSDLTLPHNIEFFLHFPARAAALQAVPAVEARGFSAQVGPGEGSIYHILLATKALVPTEEALANIRAEFSAIASASGGRYDGWGSAVVPRA